MKENSIEEDIKIVENYLANSAINEIDSNFFKNGGWETVDLEIPKSMQHILSDYKRVLKENEILKKEKEQAWEEWNNLEQGSYETEQKLKQQIKELQRENEELKNNKTLVEKILDKGKGFTLQQTQYIWEHYIPVQKIKDIIDRIDYDIKKTKEIISNDPKNNYQITRLKAMNTKSLDIKKRLQELLESEE